MNQLTKVVTSLQLRKNNKSVKYLKNLLLLLNYLGIHVDYRMGITDYYVSKTQFYLTKDLNSYKSIIYDFSSEDDSTCIYFIGDTGCSSINDPEPIYCFAKGFQIDSIVVAASIIYKFINKSK